MTVPFLYQTDDRTDGSFAAPDESKSFSERLETAMRGPAGIYETVAPVLPHSIAMRALENREAIGDLFSAAERQTRTVDAFSAREQAMAEVYERRIKAVRDLTGVTLENPEMGGYRLSEREMRRLTVNGPIDPATYRRERFEAELGALREKHPDQIEALTFGDVGEDAKAVAAGADATLQRTAATTPLSGPESLAVQFAGGLYGMRRDPLFQGSLFLGPTTAVGRTALARVGSAAVRQGLFNMGLSAAEQPTVQAWRAEVGLKHGITPAMENIGLAFLFGAIPGAAFRGVHEARVQGAVERVLAGMPEKGDMDVALRAVGADLAPHEARALRLGEEMAEADRVVQPPPSKDIAPEFADDLHTAALRAADDPIGQPSPEAVALVRSADQLAVDTPAGAFGPADAFRAHQSRAVPDGWYVHGSSGNAENIKPGLLLTKSFDVADLYARDRGSVLMVRPKEEAVTLDLTSYRSPDLARVEALFKRDYGSTERLTIYDGHVRLSADDAWERMRSDFALDDIEARGGAFDHKDWTQWVRDATGADFVRTRDGGVVLNGAAADVVRVPKSAPQAMPPEVADRIAAARPENEREAAMAASEALEDIGNRQTMARVTEERVATRLPPPPEPFAAPLAGTKDPLDRIPMVRDDGTPTMVSPRQAAKAGERELHFADVIRECKA